MKKVYVSFLLNTVTFDEADVIRTSVAAVDVFTETDVDYTQYFNATEGN